MGYVISSKERAYVSNGRSSIGKLSGSNLHVWLSVTVGTVLFGLFGYSADAAMTSLNVPDDVHSGMVGAIVGVGAGLGFWIIWRGCANSSNI